MVARLPPSPNCAVDASQQNLDCRIPVGGLLLLVPLLALPAIAVSRFAPNPKFLSGYVAAISILTWLAYYHDKKRAISGGWRVPESTLHLLELLGGWPAALLAQSCLRHKSSKKSFKFAFWIIVLLHQYIALDSLQHWKFTKAATSFAQRHTSQKQQPRHKPPLCFL
jgi:uncharacterized membrane protein YsdA (DUF1294 family)